MGLNSIKQSVFCSQ